MAEKKRSKLGCFQCKQKKKKCDEIKPICTSCLKSNKICRYKPLENSVVKSQRKVDSIVCKDIVGEIIMKNLEHQRFDEINIETISYGHNNDMFKLLNEYISPDPELKIKLPVDLSESEIGYFEYYCKSILPELSILPQEYNFYSKIYIPLALKEPALLYSLIGWGCKMMKNDGINYLIENEEAEGYCKKVMGIIDQNNLYLNEEKFMVNFCSYMSLVYMNISVGDINEWSTHFTSCFNMINRMPGNFKYLMNFSHEGILLAENFAYFDILASQSNENGTFYPISDYDDVFSNVSNAHDPAQGCIRPLTLIIGEIVTLLVEYSTLQVSLDLTDCSKYELMANVIDKAEKLDKKILFTKPDLSCLKHLNTPEELEGHLTLFDVYQISAQIYLRQVIKKLPSVVPEIEMLFFHLKEGVAFLVKTKFRKSLGFPMLVTALAATSKEDRQDVKSLFENLIQCCGYLSVYQKLWTVIQKVWELNQNGNLYVDWYKITKQFGWRLNLGR